MENLPKKYLSRDQLLEKYSFFSANMLKNLLYKDINEFRKKVVRKLGRRIIFDEDALLLYISKSNHTTEYNEPLRISLPRG